MSEIGQPLQRESFQGYQFSDHAINLILFNLFPEHQKLQAILANEKNRLERPVCYVIGSNELLNEFLENCAYQDWIQSGILRLWNLDAWEDQLASEMDNPRSSLFSRELLFFYKDSSLIESFQRQYQFRVKKFKRSLEESKQKISRHYSNYSTNQSNPKIYVAQSCLTVATKKFSRALAQSLADLGYSTFIHHHCDLSMVDSTAAEIMDIATFLPDIIINAPNVFRRKDEYAELPIPCIIPMQDHAFNAMGIEYIKKNGLHPMDRIITHLKRFESQYRDLVAQPQQILHSYLPFEPASTLSSNSTIKSASIGYVKTMIRAQSFYDYLKIQMGIPESNQGLLAEIDQLLKGDILADRFVLVDERFKLPFGQMVPQWEHHLRSYYWIDLLRQHRFPIHLYGAHWDQFPELKQFAHGPLEGDAYLNQFKQHQINLSLNPYTTFHPRIFDGAQFSAFFLVSKIPAAVDVNPMPDCLVEGIHYDSFSSSGELIEKCQYYLARPKLCEEIGCNLQREVLANFTFSQFATDLVSMY
jgi:hypothetical protein